MGYFFHFSRLYPATYIELYICQPIQILHLNFKAALALPKTAQTHKSVSFICIVWSTIYVYLWRKHQFFSQETWTYVQVIDFLELWLICSQKTIKIGLLHFGYFTFRAEISLKILVFGTFFISLKYLGFVYPDSQYPVVTSPQFSG